MKRTELLFLPFLFCMPAEAQNQQNLIFVPVIRADIGESPLPQGGVEGRARRSRTFLRNFGAQPGDIKAVSFFSPACFIQSPLGPGAGRDVCSASDRPVDFIALEVGANVAVAAEMYRTKSRSACGPFTEVIHLGGASLPTFSGLFAAGTTTTTNYINLGGRNLTEACSKLPEEAYPRRVNLTLANGGDARATFTVQFFPLRTGPVLSTLSFELEPREVRQINGVQPDYAPYPESVDINNTYVWASVTSDQPYVGYLSSVFDSRGTDTMPLQVFPLRPLR